MEVSSHALVMGRVDGVVFDVGGVPQPRPRPPRLPPRHGRLLRGQGARCFTPEHSRARAGRPSTTSGAGGWSSGPTVPVADALGDRRATPTGGPPTSSCRDDRRDVPRASGRGVDVAGRLPDPRRLQRRPTRSPRSPPRRPPATTRRAVAARDRRRPRRARPARADRRGPGLRGRRRLRPQARRRRGRARAPCARSPAGRLIVVHRRRRRPRPRQAAADGRDRRAAAPTCWSSPTTTRAARTPPRSAPRSWPGRARRGRAEVRRDRRPAGRDRRGRRRARAGRRRAGRRQGARDRPGGRRRGAPVRRPRRWPARSCRR